MSILSAHCGQVQQLFPHFSPIPPEVSADPRLESRDVHLLTILLDFARGKGECWPSDSTLAKRIRASVATVQRCMRRLKAAGWLASIRVRPRPGNMTGRVLRILFAIAPRPGAGQGERAPEQGRAELREPLPPSPVRDEGKCEGRDETGPVSTPELIGQLPGRPELVEAVAVRLADDCRDHGSIGYYRRLCRSVASGGAPVARLADAFRASRDPRAGKPGAVLAQFWGHWRARPASGGVSADPTAYAASRAAQRARERAEEMAAGRERQALIEAAASDPQSPLNRTVARFFSRRPRPA